MQRRRGCAWDSHTGHSRLTTPHCQCLLSLLSQHPTCSVPSKALQTGYKGVQDTCQVTIPDPSQAALSSLEEVQESSLCVMAGVVPSLFIGSLHPPQQPFLAGLGSVLLPSQGQRMKNRCSSMLVTVQAL